MPEADSKSSRQLSRIRRDIQQEVEYTTGMSVEILKITVRSISQPED